MEPTPGHRSLPAERRSTRRTVNVRPGGPARPATSAGLNPGIHREMPRRGVMKEAKRVPPGRDLPDSSLCPRSHRQAVFPVTDLQTGRETLGNSHYPRDSGGGVLCCQINKLRAHPTGMLRSGISVDMILRPASGQHETSRVPCEDVYVTTTTTAYRKDDIALDRIHFDIDKRECLHP